MEQTWKRKEYDSWEDAFMGLSPAVRQQSVRVAAYTRVLFIEASTTSFGQNVPGGSKRMSAKYADLAYKCGMYHQLGKALVPTEYQTWQKDFTDEETAVYKKYTTDGRLLVASLQEKTLRAREKRTGKEKEYHTDNIPWMMVRESCSQHMERYNGTGYPEGLIGDQISPIAQIVGLAKELDRISAETKSENPFAEAYDKLIAESGKAFSQELIEILKNARSKCRNVYNKYVHYTMTLPKTIPLLEKKEGRPMGLSWRPLTDGEDGNTTSYEGEMWFNVSTENKGEKDKIEDMEEMLGRIGIVTDMSMYFLYEATDALLRVQNCKLSLDFIILDMIPSFYKEGSLLQKMNQVIKDQTVDKSRLVLTLPKDIVQNANKSVEEVIRRYLKNGYSLMLDNWDPAMLSLERVRDYGFKFVRLSPALYMKEETASLIASLIALGITVVASGANDHETVNWLKACGVRHMSGTLSGVPVTEDELVRDCLLREREDG